MWRVLGWMAVVVVGCTAGRVVGERPADPRLAEAQVAFEEAKKLEEAGKYEEAVVQAQQALELREAVHGSAHLGVADSLNLLGVLERQRANHALAEALHERALAIREAALGQQHPHVAQSLHNLAILYRDQGLYSRAEPLLERALSIREAILGKQHPDTAASLNSLANLYLYQGLYSRAEPLLERALFIREASLGKRHTLVATSLNDLASLYWKQGLYRRAEPLLERALSIREATLGKQHPDTAASLNNLASLYRQQGLYSRVEPLLERALSIWEAAFGKQHPDVALSLNNLATFYKEQGLYSRAEPMLKRALTIREATLGQQHPDVATSLNNLADLYWQQGLYSRAEPLLERALSIREAALGQQHPHVADSLNTLANLYWKQGLYSRAEPLHERALSIKEAALGTQHPDVALSLNNLANLYRERGSYSRAEPLLERALSIWEGALGTQHPEVTSSLHSLAILYWQQGLYNRAEPLYERALSIREAALGRQNPRVGILLHDLAQLRLAQNQPAQAVPLLLRAFTLDESRLRQEALEFSEARLASFLEYMRSREEFLYALLRAYPADTRVQRLALASVLLRKGRSVEEAANTSRTIYHSLGAEDRATFERLRGLRTQLAALSHQGLGSLTPAEYQQRLKSLADEGDALEAQLARHSAPLRALTALPGPADIVDQVAAALPRDSALIEFVAYMDRPVVPKPGTPVSKLPSELRYLALVLLPSATIRTVDLGPAAPIDKAASIFHDALARKADSWQGPAQALHSLAFRPLLPLLGKVRRLYLAGDGQLNLVPFDALHDGKAPLVDSFHFTYLTSGKDLLPPPQDIPPSNSVVVLAAPDFGAAPSTAPDAQRQLPPLARGSSAIERFFSTTRAGLDKLLWEPLPGTRQEAQAIQQLLPQAQLFLGAEASKQRLLQLPTPGVLHIATHGFFLENSPSPEATRAIAYSDAGDLAAQKLPDPLLRSGLVFSGAGAEVPNALENSFATALELLGLDLWGTQLVVLSACETGRGDVKLGQGVYGLRRAFLAAGAETVVSSLWKVKDDTTPQLMQRYYRNLLAGKPRVSALREAMLELRQTHPHPYAWAPFIALGRDAPLQGLAPPAQAKPGM